MAPVCICSLSLGLGSLLLKIHHSANLNKEKHKGLNMRTISWFSCGAASAVATKLALLEDPETVVAYCEVIEEHPDNKRFLKECEEWFGVEVLVLRNEFYKGSIYNVFEKNYMRTPAGSPCTRALKKQVREKFEQPGDRQVFGYTVEEENRVNRFIDANNEVDIWPVLIEKGLTKEDCLAIVQNAGIELPVLYKQGFHHNNCIMCVKGGMGYQNKMREHYPEEFKRMADLEKRKGYTVLKNPDGSPLYLHDLDPSAGNYPTEPNIECGIFCVMAEQDIKG